jgi:hypothetical protein
MTIKINNNNKGITLSMLDFSEEMLLSIPKTNTYCTPTGTNLFEINDSLLLSSEKSKLFYSVVLCYYI